MEDLVVRQVHDTEQTARREIVDAATRELRNTYRPREDRVPCGVAPSGVLVALKGSTVVGTAEYVRKDHYMYVQGVAVHPEYRGHGVCRALLRGVEALARAEKLPALVLCVIEETGNTEIFRHLGFKVVSRSIAPNHVSPGGGPVTRLDMQRKIT